MFPHDGSTYEALLAAADHLMYRDKAARRGLLTMGNAPGPDFLPTTMYDGSGTSGGVDPLAQTLA